MKKILSIFVIFLIHTQVFATDLLLKASYFRPWSKILREIYGDSEAFVGLEWRESCFRYFGFFAQFDYLREKGKSIGAQQDTVIWLLPFGVGVLGYYPINPCIRVYLGGGPMFTWTQVHNASDVVVNVHDTSFGVLGKAGINVLIPKSCLSLDAFIEGNYCNASIGRGTDIVTNHDLQVGGLKIGGGIGYRF